MDDSELNEDSFTIEITEGADGDYNIDHQQNQQESDGFITIGEQKRFKRTRENKRVEHSEKIPEDGSQSIMSPQVCLIIREDKKAIPFNFFNSCITNWSVLQTLDQSSISRNAKGTVITANIKNEDRVNFGNSDRMFAHNNVKYEAFSPRQYSQFIGEVTFDLRDMEDKSILLYNEVELLETLSPPNRWNQITSIHKIYPRNPVPASEHKNFNVMRISLEFSIAIPDKVFFESVAVNVLPYFLPPKRCFICQHYGHAALSCRRKQVCRTCAQDHPQSECKVEEASQFKCASCGGNHRASSNRCEFFKAAQETAARLQERKITQEEAAIQYANLYSRKPKNIQVKHSLIKGTQNLPIPQSGNSQPLLSNNQRSKTNGTDKGPGAINKRRSYFSQESFEDNSWPGPGQGSKKGKEPPFHSTQRYSDILNGTAWEREDREERDNSILPSFPPPSQCLPRSPRKPRRKEKKFNLFGLGDLDCSTDEDRNTKDSAKDKTTGGAGSQQTGSGGFGFRIGDISGTIQKIVDQLKLWITNFIKQVVESLFQSLI